MQYFHLLNSLPENLFRRNEVLHNEEALNRAVFADYSSCCCWIKQAFCQRLSMAVSGKAFLMKF